MNGTEFDATEVFAAATSSVRDARSFVKQTLASWGVAQLTDMAILLVSELATNAIVHARTDYAVRVIRRTGAIRIAVTDASPNVPERRNYAPTSGTGRGIAIVAEASTAWGIDEGVQGKTVWFELSDGANDESATSHESGVTATGAELDAEIDAYLTQFSDNGDDRPSSGRSQLLAVSGAR